VFFGRGNLYVRGTWRRKWDNDVNTRRELEGDLRSQGDTAPTFQQRRNLDVGRFGVRGIRSSIKAQNSRKN